jgi:winged helix DNA-binding protein
VSDLAATRARAQHLLGGRLRDPGAAVREVVGVQAQEPVAAALSIRVRTAGLTRVDVDRALVEERSIVRLWAMRGTIHLVPAEDARWLVELLGPLALTATHRRLGQLGVPEDDRPRAVELIRSALAEHGPLTRAELMEPLAHAGITTGGQAAAHLPYLAAVEGHVCFGPTRGGKPTFVLRDDWLGRDLPRLSRERALAELARRYARAYGPAEPEDFAAWSGLPLRDAREGWAAVRQAGSEHVDPAAPDSPDVRLLPAFDTYLLGYRSRDFAVPAAHARKVWPGGGIVRPTVVANGRAVATWKRSGTKVELDPFGRARVDAREEIADVRRFLDARPARTRSSTA